nr:P-loop NTPase [Microbacterium immunditiarum]
MSVASRDPASYAPGAGKGAVVDLLHDVDVVVLQASRDTLTADVVALCDRRGVRIAPLSAAPGDERVAGLFGLPPAMPVDVEPWRLAEALDAPRIGSGRADAVGAPRAARGTPPRDEVRPPAERAAGAPPTVHNVHAWPVEREPEAHRPGPSAPRVIVVWGPAGSPGRTTMAIELAVELARGGRHVGLVDADSHAPSLALVLGLADEGPGFAAACRQAELGGLDARELTRIATPLGRSGVDVLTGINRPSRWPELSDARVTGALAACRDWAEHTVVDVAAPLERDEEIMSDLEGPRRNAATLAALRSADLVVAVVGADPVGVSRFLRAYPELRSTIGSTPVAVVANRLRGGTLGVDARGQVRRTLDRFAGIEDVWFVPADHKAADASILAARPIAEVAPRSSFALALRRFVGEAVVPPAAPARRTPRRRARKQREAAVAG